MEQSLMARRFLGLAALVAAAFLPSISLAQPTHCLALYGECKYKAGFAHFEYVNPNAPKGGTMKLAETGSYDNLNPFILNGLKAPFVEILFETLMVASQDEPQSMYGLLAESAGVAADNSSVIFTLRPQAKWQDGTSVTADDVVFSFYTLRDKGDPTFKIRFASVAGCEKLDARRVKFTFSDAKNRELPQIVAAIPVISKAYYTANEFTKTTLTPPLGSGPYKVDMLEQGRFIIYKRDPNYWGKDLAVNRGQYNFDTLRYDMYRDENVALEALKAGEYDFRQEYIARNWAKAYDIPAIREGKIIKREIAHEIPQGMQAFIFNTRQEKFADARVREAIALALDYEWLNKTIFYGAYTRNRSYFEHTQFQAKGVPTGKELALLEPYRNSLPKELFEKEFSPPVTDGSGNPRENLLRAQALLEQAGWVIKDGKLVGSKGQPLAIEFMLRQPTMERVIGPMRKNLERLGINSSIRMVDDSQYQKRTDEFDFDVVSIWINRGVFFPGNEQMALWHSSQAKVKGSPNLVGTEDPLIDHLLSVLTTGTDKESMIAAGRALDRVLLWRHYAIPHWHSNGFRVAYQNKFGIPAITPKYNLGLQTWWIKDAANSKEVAKP
ncbi:MAG: extracellular solute-binding protein [Rickettsiales bacterium]|nr:extracellular solute-binding protein [Rickettsiales bacterium]